MILCLALLGCDLGGGGGGGKKCDPPCEAPYVCAGGGCTEPGVSPCDPLCEPHHVCGENGCYSPKDCEPPCEGDDVCDKVTGTCVTTVEPGDCDPPCYGDHICHEGVCYSPKDCEPPCEGDDVCDKVTGSCVDAGYQPCCIESGACILAPAATCLELGGVTHPGTSCRDVDCGAGCSDQTVDASDAAKVGPPAVGAKVMDLVNALICGVDLVTPHSDGESEKAGAGDHTEVHAMGALRVPEVPAALLAGAFSEDGLLRCGEGALGLTLCPAGAGPMPAGDYVLALNVTLGKIPLEDSESWYQYGFVFDADGEEANNYQATEAFPNDFFQGTDRWYAAGCDPAAGWQLQVTDASGEWPQEAPTNARIVIAGSTMVLVVPGAEFEVPEPDFRVTAFQHAGDWGTTPPHDWSGDVEPPMSSGLAAFPSF